MDALNQTEKKGFTATRKQLQRMGIIVTMLKEREWIPTKCIVPRWLDRFLDLIGVNVLDCRRAGAEQNPTDHIAP